MSSSLNDMAWYGVKFETKENGKGPIFRIVGDKNGNLYLNISCILKGNAYLSIYIHVRRC